MPAKCAKVPGAMPIYEKLESSETTAVDRAERTCARTMRMMAGSVRECEEVGLTNLDSRDRAELCCVGIQLEYVKAVMHYQCTAAAPWLLTLPVVGVQALSRAASGL